MGSYGIVSRIATLNLGGFMTYASTDEAKETAPGQLPASTVRKILEEINCGN
jgi:3-dehydroquinate dehydratase-1/3-dehydroquinate dehydratase/shikimate dehydrogenase